MRVLGVTEAGASVFDVRLGHGSTPETTAWDAGYAAVRPLSADRNAGGDLALSLRVEPRGVRPRPEQPGRGRDRGLTLGPGEIPVIRQRVAAYGVVRSDRGLLATQYSSRTSADGRWGMPGGGIHEAESPVAAVLREVHEETAQQVEVGELAAVQTGHWIGRSPRGLVEDFHAVRLVYRANCGLPSDPVVLDAEGTTSAARWVPWREWPRMDWTVGWQQLLGQLLA